MASNFTNSFYAALREKEKPRSSSPSAKSDYTSSFYKALREKDGETKTRLTTTPRTTRADAAKPATTGTGNFASSHLNRREDGWRRQDKTALSQMQQKIEAAAPPAEKKTTLSDIYKDLDASKTRVDAAKKEIDDYFATYGATSDDFYDKLAAKYGAAPDDNGEYIFADKAAYDAYSAEAASLGLLYDKYNTEVNAYNGYLSQAQNYRSADTVSGEIAVLEKRRDNLRSERSKLTHNQGLSYDHESVKKISDEISEIDAQLKPLKKEHDTLEKEEEQYLIDTGEYRKAGAKDILWNSLKRGWYNAKYGEASYDDMSDNSDEAKQARRYQQEIGQYGAGNIDLYARGEVSNPDGTYSTVDSFSKWDDRIGKEVLVPTVIQVNGEWQRVSEDEAWKHYVQTGEYLGVFDTPQEADEYAEKLHIAQDYYYRGTKKKKYADILSGDDYNFVTDGWLEDAISGGAEQIGLMAQTFFNPYTAASAASLAATAAIAGNAGPQIVAPEEIITVPAAFTAGLGLGTTKSIYEIEAGLAYEEMIENGISDKTAQIAANLVGGVNAIIEVAQLDELIDAYKILNGSRATQKFATKLAVELLDRGINVLTETGEEELQELATITGAQIAGYIDNGELVYSSGEVLDRLADTGKSSALAFGALNVPAIASNIAFDAAGRASRSASKAVESDIAKRGYGEHGKAVLASFTEEYGLTSEEANTEFHLPYLQGLSNMDASETDFTSSLQQEAFNAGKLDRIMNTKKDAKASKSAVVEQRERNESLWKEAATKSAEVVQEKRSETKKSTATKGGKEVRGSRNGQIEYSYAGEKAKTANMERLRKAKELERQGVDNETIRQKTGWFKGMDGKWRFEIDDSAAEFRKHGDAQLLEEPGYRRLGELTQKWADRYEKNGEALTEAESAEMEALQEQYSDRVWEEKYLLRDFLRHDALFEAYPRLKGVSLAFDSLDNGTNGYFDKRSNTIVLADNLIGSDKRTLLHEVQHIIQKYEGFAQGSSPAYWRKNYDSAKQTTIDKLRNKIAALEGKLPAPNEKWTEEADGIADEIDALEDRILQIENGALTDGAELYRNTAGEIEARDAAARRDMTSEERKLYKPDLGDENTVFAENAGESYTRSTRDAQKTTQGKNTGNAQYTLKNLERSDSISARGDDNVSGRRDKANNRDRGNVRGVYNKRGERSAGRRAVGAVEALTDTQRRELQEVIFSSVGKSREGTEKLNKYGYDRVAGTIYDLSVNSREYDELLMEAYDGLTKADIERIREIPKLDKKVLASSVLTASDKDYLAAVERGETEALRKMVEESARKAGYTLFQHHFTDADFTVFKFGEFGFHVGTVEQANYVGKGRKGKVLDLYIRAQNPLYWPIDVGMWSAKELLATMDDVFEDFENREEIEAKFEEFGSIEDTNKGNARLREYLKSLGYDSIKYENTQDREYGDPISESYILFDAEQLKSADLITYDDDGKVIPLSQRFNAENEDIRFSLEGQSSLSDDTEAEERWSAERVGSDKKTPMRLSEIIEKIRHDFGINITTGHIRGKDIRGLYNRRNKGIKTKIANNLPTVAHELGHHLDNTYSLREHLNDTLEKELVDGLDPGMKAVYPKKKWVTEGIAEYIRKYLQNRETAAIDYPEFTKYFLNSLSKTDAALIAQLADEVNAYYALDADTAASSIRFREEGSADAHTFSEKIKEKASALYQAWVDANHGIKLYDKATGSNAYTLANNAAYSDAMAGQIITGDLTDANGQYVAPGLKTAMHGINLNDKTEYRLFGEYLTVKHGPERLAEGMRIFADDRKNSTAFMERRRDELEEQYPQFKEAAERLYDFQREFLQTWGVDTGLVSQESADEWAQRWHYYVPLNRAVSEKQRGVGAKRGFANQNSTIKKAIGSGLDIVHPVDNIINNIVKMVNAGVRNNVMRVITDSADALGANAEFLERVPTPLVRRGFDVTGVKTNLVNWFEDSSLSDSAKDTASGIVNNIDDILYQYGKGLAHGDVITVLKGGKQEFWKINDPLLLQSITTLSPQKMEGILDAYAVVSRFMTANITGYNVIWSLFSNFPRDLMTLFTYSKTKNPFKLFRAMGSAYINKAGNMGKGLDPLYREYLAMGGGNVSAYTADRNLAKNARKKFAGKVSKNPVDYFAFLSELIEMGPRYATYKLLRENGSNPQEAFAGAMDITVNFRRGGRIAREMNKVFPFFNVSIQGLDKFRRWITAEDAGNLERKKVVRSRMVSYVAVSAALAALFYALNNGDDEDEKNYEQLSNYQKNSFWNIPLGDGKYFAIPKPREIGVLSSFFETSMEYGIGENDHAFDEFYDYAAQNLLPKIASDIAQIPTQGFVEAGASFIGNLGMIGVLGYLAANRDFLGRPIVASGLQNLEAKDQYTSRTSKIAHWIGQAFNTSPAKVDFFFQQVLGGFWKWQKALFPVGGENVDFTLGVQNTYVKDNQYSTDLVNWMYDQADKSAKKKNSNPTDMDAAITAKMDSNMTTFYSRFYALSKDKQETAASRGARQTVLDMILEYQKATDSGATTAAQRAVYDVAKKKGSTDVLPSVMQTTVKDGNKKTHTLSPAQYVEYQTDYLRLYWEHVEDGYRASMSDAEKAAFLKNAKTVAKKEATNRTLARIGAKKTDYFDGYGTAEPDAIISYKTKRTEANADGSVTQDEVTEIILTMLDEGLDDDTAYNLYTSEYKSSKDVVDGAKAAGVDAETFLEFKHGLVNLEYEKGANGARKEAFIEMLDELGLDSEAYDYLFSTEYKSNSSSNSIFGDSLF